MLDERPARSLLARQPAVPAALRLPVCPHKLLESTRAVRTEAAMPGGNGCLTARGLRNVVIASAPSVIVIISRFLPIDGLWSAAARKDDAASGPATSSCARRAPTEPSTFWAQQCAAPRLVIVINWGSGSEM